MCPWLSPAKTRRNFLFLGMLDESDFVAGAVGISTVGVRTMTIRTLDPLLQLVQIRIHQPNPISFSWTTSARTLPRGYAGSERTTRRAVAEVKAVYRAGRRRVHRPWIPSLNLSTGTNAA
jgi:hypothetical protein